MNRIYLEVTGPTLEQIRFLSDNFELCSRRIQDKFVLGHSGFTLYFDEEGILETLNKELIWNPQHLKVELGYST